MNKCQNLTDVKAVLDDCLAETLRNRQSRPTQAYKSYLNKKLRHLKSAILVVDREITRKRLDGGREGGGDVG